MESKFSFLATGRTNEELLERIDNRQKYLPETVEASVTELQFRKHEFSDEELKVITEDVQAQRNNAVMVTSNPSLFNSDYKNTIVEDADAPLMYSRRAIYLFALFFGGLFGSIMMAMNISKTEKKNNAVIAILFGIVFTALQVYLVSKANPGSGGSFQYLGGLIAAYILNYVFWRNYIGYATFYRARQIWVPLIIGVIWIGLIVWATIDGMK